MNCPKCGNENPPKLKFCVKCGTNLENPQEINYEQVDMGHYHSEGDKEAGGFRLGGGTFTIKDTAPVSNTSDLYTAAELNDDDEEYDFSSIDEPFIPKLDTGRVALPQPPERKQPVVQPVVYGNYGVPAGGMPQITGQSPMNGIPPMTGQPPMNGMPPMGGMPQMAGQPPMNGMPPMCGMPAMSAQPQIIGYDPNGMPVYGQPAVFAQPQIIGYDPNGMPVYGQPAVFAQPQIIGSDPNGMPVYGQPPLGAVPPMGLMPQNPFAQFSAQPVQEEKRVEVPDDFWEFFDGGKKTEHAEPADDFYGKRSSSGSAADVGMKRFERKKNDYMGDIPLVDASGLAPNTVPKYNKLYMKATAEVNASELQAKEKQKTYNYMGITKDVNAGDLDAYSRKRSQVTMSVTEEANADQLKAYSPEHRESIMAQADRAVEAMPKKKAVYISELDLIELPEHMQARKTDRKASPEIPGLPEFYKNQK